MPESTKGYFKDQSRLEFLKGSIQFTDGAIKTLVLINGGAAIALLTFIEKNCGTGQTSHLCRSTLQGAISDFAWGVAAASFMGFFSFLTLRLRFAVPPNRKCLSIICEFVAFIFSVASIICFLCGLIAAARAFNEF